MNKTILILTGFLPFVISCFPGQDAFPYVNDFKQELSQAAIDKCTAANPKAKASDCNIKNCLVSPITMLGMQDLLADAGKVLKDVQLSYWVDAGTAISAARFGAHLPWDDDVDLGVLTTDFTDAIKNKLIEEFSKLGLEFTPIIGTNFVSTIAGFTGVWQLSYLKPRLFKLILSYKPTISSHDLENLWIQYEREGSKRPHLDIILYDEITPGQYTINATTVRKDMLGNKTLPKDVLIGAKKEVDVLGKMFSDVQNIGRYGEIVYKSKDILRDFVIYGQRSKICGKTRYENINDFPETRDFILDYLDFVYNGDAAKSLGMKFDRNAAKTKLKP